MSDISFFTLNAITGDEGTAVFSGVDTMGNYQHARVEVRLADMSVTDISEYLQDLLGDTEADYYPAPYRRVLHGPIDAYSVETRALDWLIAAETYGDTDEEADYYPSCRVCGDPIDYCTGHGEIGDPEGYRRLSWVYPEWAV